MAQSYYVNVESTGGGGGSGIGYRRIVPDQYTSYRTGDTGWHSQNGTFDYSSDPTCVAYTQELATSVSGAAGFYELLYPNAFGNYYRFTNDIGNGPNVGNAGFSAAGFTGATPNYIIDHYTGLAFSNDNSGLISAARGPGNTWENVIDIIYASTENGYNDWFPMSKCHIPIMQNMASNYETSNNISYGITATTLVALGDTALTSTTQVYYLRRGQIYIQTGAKTATATVIFKCRNHY